MSPSKLSRREFLRLAEISIGAAAVAACTPQVITQVVKETSVVTQNVPVNVEQTTVVEVPVTPTSPPLFVTIQGRELPADAAPLDKQVEFDPGTEPSNLDISRNLYAATCGLNYGGEPLLRLDVDQQITAAGAESWKAGPDVKYWEFTIRKDAKWSDGTPITSDDWVFTAQHYVDPKLGNPWAWFYYDIKGMAAYNTGKGSAADIGFVKVDDRVFQIWGENPAPHIPSMMTYQAVVPCPKHKAEADPEHWADTIDGFVSSGQYTITKWVHNQQTVWQTHKYYNGPFKPGVQTVVQNIGTANTNWWEAWKNKEIDIAQLSPAQVAEVRANPDLNPLLHWWTDPKPWFVALNPNMKPLDNLDLRMALAKSIDRDTLCYQVLNGTSVPAYAMLPPGFPANNPELKPIQAFDLDAAKAHLEKAGFKDGKDPATGQPLKLTWTTRAADGVRPQYVQQQWQTNLGIQVVLDNKENALWRDMRTKHQMAIFLNFYEYDYMDPANLLAAIWRSIPGPNGEKNWGSSQHAWHNDQFDSLCTQAGQEADVAKRIQEYQEAEKILVSDVGGIFLDWELVFQIWWPYVTGWKPNKEGVIEFRYLYVARYYYYIRNDIDNWRKSTY
ncbi:MAG: peptide ABC transporter substrate-binding protein [Omnitrophica WOR_2 bacterium]